jgi:hypothetical protein
MLFNKLPLAAALLPACLVLTSVRAADGDDSAKTELRTQFDYLCKLAGPMPDEYAWRNELNWTTRIQEARERAVAEDKPLFVLVSANSYPLGRT